MGGVFRTELRGTTGPALVVGSQLRSCGAPDLGWGGDSLGLADAMVEWGRFVRGDFKGGLFRSGFFEQWGVIECRFLARFEGSRLTEGSERLSAFDGVD